MSPTSTHQAVQAFPRVQFRQMTEVSLDASVIEELSRMASQSRAMMNREREAHLQLQQSIEAVATERPGLPLWKPNSESKHRRPDRARQQASAEAWNVCHQTGGPEVARK
eukprot:12907085-Prorocentrum_lima.AAC.1